MLVKSGATLVVDTDGVVRVSNKTNAKGSAIKGESESSRIQINGRLYYQYSTYSAGYTYFYTSDGTSKAVSDSNYDVTNGTYTWDAALGDNAGGWKAEATE